MAGNKNSGNITSIIIDEVNNAQKLKIIKAFGNFKAKRKEYETEDDIFNATRELYKNLFDELIKDYANVADNIARSARKDYWAKDNHWGRQEVVDFLNRYSPITKYVFAHEVDRKTARAAESFIASNMAPEEIKRARNLWVRQVAQATIEWYDYVRITTLKRAGCRYVVWRAKIDGQQCSVCYHRNGKKYRIENVPKKDHIGCRCIMSPVWETE